jgi:hypothetical protein
VLHFCLPQKTHFLKPIFGSLGSIICGIVDIQTQPRLNIQFYNAYSSELIYYPALGGTDCVNPRVFQIFDLLESPDGGNCLFQFHATRVVTVVTFPIAIRHILCTTVLARYDEEAARLQAALSQTMHGRAMIYGY